jgi:hypothetical protein
LFFLIKQIFLDKKINLNIEFGSKNIFNNILKNNKLQFSENIYQYIERNRNLIKKKIKFAFINIEKIFFLYLIVKIIQMK